MNTTYYFSTLRGNDKNDGLTVNTLCHQFSV